MKALVTGAHGQLGKALVACAPDDAQIVAMSRADLNLTDPKAIAALIDSERPDVIMNAAAYTAVDKAESEPDLARAINTDAVRIMAEALAKYGGQLVHVSTDFVFDGASSSPYVPDAKRNPSSVYGKTKAAGEDAAGPEAIVCRTSWVYAPGGNNFVRTMLRLMNERDELRVVDDQIGSPTSAEGLAKTLWALADRNIAGIYHHRDAGVASWYDFAMAIAEEATLLGLISTPPVIIPIPAAEYPTPAVRPAFSVLNDHNTRLLLDDRPPHWRVALRSMLKKEKELGCHIR